MEYEYEDIETTAWRLVNYVSERAEEGELWDKDEEFNLMKEEHVTKLETMIEELDYLKAPRGHQSFVIFIPYGYEVEYKVKRSADY